MKRSLHARSKPWGPPYLKIEQNGRSQLRKLGNKIREAEDQTVMSQRREGDGCFTEGSVIYWDRLNIHIVYFFPKTVKGFKKMHNSQG